MRSLLLLKRQIINSVAATHLVVSPDATYFVSDGQLVTPTAQIPLPVQAAIVSCQYLNESHSICVVYSTGEIVQVNIDESLSDELGAIEEGVKAAKWAPDEETLAIVSGTDSLILMTKNYDVLSEVPLQTDDYGQGKPIALGWGQKSTQFHGSLGKQAAQSPSEPAVDSQINLTNMQEDCQIRIAWRGDGDFFAVSGLQNEKRKIRIYSRAGVLMSTTEDVNGMGSAFDWQPSGSLLASVQYTDNQNLEDKVIFFERNGLRRYDFSLRNIIGERQKTVEEQVLNNSNLVDDEISVKRRRNIAVKELKWNSDSTVLAVWLEEEGIGHCVQLWKRNNYHWYLQQEMRSSLPLSNVVWHPEESLQIYILSAVGIEHIELVWDTFSVRSQQVQNHSGAVAVVDGSFILLTPFRLQNVPPPMSSIKLRTSKSSTPIHCTFTATGSGLDQYIGVLFPSGQVKIYKWALSSEGVSNKINYPVLDGSIDISSEIDDFSNALQIALITTGDSLQVAVLLTKGKDQTQVAHISLNTKAILFKDVPDARMVFTDGIRFFVETSTGTVRDLDNRTIHNFPDFCPWIRCLEVASSLAGLTGNGRLYVGNEKLADDCSSMELTEQFLLWTTLSNRLKILRRVQNNNIVTNFIDEEGLEKRSQLDAFVSGDIKANDRFVERGSRIVTVVAHTMTVVLQMPRGNLETISPRPLVLEVVKSLLTQSKYRDAFLACRKNRVDLNLMCDHNPKRFLVDAGVFVDQVNDVDMLNVFLSGLAEANVCNTKYQDNFRRDEIEDKINTVCNCVRAHMETSNQDRFIHCILTTYVCRQPPDYEGALRKILTLQDNKMDDAVKYIVFLSDTNALYDLALGMYEFKLVTLIAQQSNKDPREYIPFLRGLRQLDPNVAKFRIDDHLGRHEKALYNLAQAGPAHFEAVLQYIEQNNLFQHALQIYKNQPESWRVILCLYGQHLVETERYFDGAVVLHQSGQDRDAMEAYRCACAWREFFDLAMALNEPMAAIKEVAEDMAETLKDRRQYRDAAIVLLDHAQDVKGAIDMLTSGQEWVEAIRIAMLHKQVDLITRIILPEMSQVRDRILDDIEEMATQFSNQSSRLIILATIRTNDPDSFFDRAELIFAEDGNLQADGESEWGGTQFTRYTVAPTTVSRKSRHSSKTASSRRKNKLKQMTGGRKGTVSEEEYILSSINKLLDTRLKFAQDETRALLVSYLRLRRDKEGLDKARELQLKLGDFEAIIEKTVAHAWPTITDDYPESAKVYKEKPILKLGSWKLQFL